jgi:hypothetical protein
MGVVLTRQLNRGVFLRGGRVGMSLASSLQVSNGEQPATNNVCRITKESEEFILQLVNEA